MDAQLGTDHPYGHEEERQFEVIHPGATHIRVRFRDFVTEACCDKVAVKDGQGRTVAVYAGERGDFWSAEALGDTLVLEFRSDFSISGYGFDVDAYEVSFVPSPWAELGDWRRLLRPPFPPWEARGLLAGPAGWGARRAAERESGIGDPERLSRRVPWFPIP